MTPAACADRLPLLHGLADGELDAVHAAETEAHVRDCPACAAALSDIRVVSQLLRSEPVGWEAPDRLRRAVMADLAEPPDSPLQRLAEWLRRTFGRPALWVAAPSLVALGLALLLVLPPSASRPSLDDELVASHVRSLLADHLTDVVSSDQHTVKPWFGGKLDFSLPVVDLAGSGFPLIGGRLDYLDGRVVAALVFKRNGHVINLFAWPGSSTGAGKVAIKGFTILGWNAAGIEFRAVSDVNPADLVRFRQEFQAAAPTAEPAQR